MLGKPITFTANHHIPSLLPGLAGKLRWAQASGLFNLSRGTFTYVISSSSSLSGAIVSA
jgi:hypothetical protein